jgi:hypothetical protein
VLPYFLEAFLPFLQPLAFFKFVRPILPHTVRQMSEGTITAWMAGIPGLPIVVDGSSALRHRCGIPNTVWLVASLIMH